MNKERTTGNEKRKTRQTANNTEEYSHNSRFKFGPGCQLQWPKCPYFFSVALNNVHILCLVSANLYFLPRSIQHINRPKYRTIIQRLAVRVTDSVIQYTTKHCHVLSERIGYK